MIDSHAHLNDDKLIDNIDNINAECQKVNVTKIINVGYDISSSIKAVDIAKKYENMYAVIGIHPHDSKTYNEQIENELITLSNNDKVIAIGEIGLDYHYNLSPKEDQIDAFIKQIKLANSLVLPVVIHTREAIGDTMEILNQYRQYINHGLLFHCFNASDEVLQKVIQSGYYVSFGGAITFKNANHLLECVKNCPLERILLETDCPYMTPEPFRGQLNTPKNIPIIAKKIAEIKQIDLDTVITQTEKNTKTFFKI